MMIVPRTRLIVWTGFLFPLCGILAAISELTRLSLLFLTAFTVIVLSDAIIGTRRLKGIHMQLPDLVRFSKNKTGAIPIKIRNQRMKQKHLRIGLPFPQEIQTNSEELPIFLPKGNEFSLIEWTCTPLKRGRFILEKCFVETPSSLGFWSARQSEKIHSELRVYPNLIDERKKLAALFLNRGNFGLHTQRMVGQGREFEKLRDYVPGDSYDQIHWKATAKRGRPVTKVFQIERTQEVYVVIDSSRLTAKEVNSETVLEHFLKAGLVLGMVAQQQGDLFGIVTFNDRVRRFLRASSGKAHYSSCRDAIYTLQPQLVTPDFDDLCSFIRLRLRRRALLVILTDLNDPILSESFIRSVSLISQQHLILTNMVRPMRARPLFSQADAKRAESLYENLGGHILWNNLREVQNLLHRQGIVLTQLDNLKMSLQLVTQYLNIKQRQLL